MEANANLDARILVADDDSPSVLLLERILEIAGYRNVTSTTDPRNIPLAFEQLKPDIMILDLHMPEMDAFEVLAAVRPSLDPGELIPTIVVTGDITPEMRRRALVSGVDDFVLKPFQSTEVLMRTDHQLDRRFQNLATRGVVWQPGTLSLAQPAPPALRLIPGSEGISQEPAVDAQLMNLYTTLTTEPQVEAFNDLLAALGRLPGAAAASAPA